MIGKLIEGSAHWLTPQNNPPPREMSYMTYTKPNLLTADDLLRLYGQGVRGELIRGELHETMSTGVNHGRTVTKTVIQLGSFIESCQLGTLVASDTGIWLERDPDTVREPDIAFISAEKMPLDADIPGYSEVVPDLVMEIRSPSDSQREIREKALMWLSFGVHLVWVAHTDARTVDVYGSDGSVLTLTENDDLSGGEVLPGFSCPVRDIF